MEAYFSISMKEKPTAVITTYDHPVICARSDDILVAVATAMNSLKNIVPDTEKSIQVRCLEQHSEALHKVIDAFDDKRYLAHTVRSNTVYADDLREVCAYADTLSLEGKIQ